MKIEIKGTFTRLVEDASLIQNALRPYPVEFIFDEFWDGFVKTALFEAGGASIAVVLDDDKCTLPAECLKRAGVRLQVAVYGVKGEERISTGWCITGMILYKADLGLGQGSSAGGGTPIPDDVYEQIMAAIGDLEAAGFGGKTLAEIFREIKDSICGTATDAEVDDALNGIFGQSSGLPEIPGGSEPSDNTATDEEVDDILDAVFGKKP